MKFKILFLFGILILFLGVSNVQSATYTLNGNVIDSDTREGVANAEITLSQGGVVKSVIPYYTKSDGSFEIVGFTDIQLLGTVSVKVESSGYFSNEVRRNLPAEEGIVDLGTITLFSLSPTQPSTTSEAVPITLQKYVEEKDFDRVIVRSNVLDLDRYSGYDASRITPVGTLEYYLVPMFQGLDSSLLDLVYLKSGAVVEFWKGGKKLKSEILVYDSARELRKDCSYWLFNNKNNNRVHFEICKANIVSSSGVGKSLITGSSQVYHNGIIYPSDINQWTCKEAASAFSDEASSLSEEDLSLLRAEGKGWCSFGDLSKKDFCQDNQVWGYSCSDNCGTATMIKDCGDEKLCYDSGDGATCFGTEICDAREPTPLKKAVKLVRNVAARVTLGVVDEAKEFCAGAEKTIVDEGVCSVEVDNTLVFTDKTFNSFETMKENAKKELAEKGITKEQREAYKSCISDMLYLGIYPYQYKDVSGLNELLGHFNSFIFRTKEGKRTFAGPSREDAWMFYLGLPQKHNTFGISDYQPGKSEDIKYYYKINVFKINFAETMKINAFEGKSGLERLIFKIGKEGFIIVRDVYTDYEEGVMGDFKISLGWDESGYYLSYYDIWDLGEQSLGIEGEKGFFGKSFEIYDRIYYDPETFEVLEPLNCDPSDPSTFGRAGKFAKDVASIVTFGRVAKPAGYCDPTSTEQTNSDESRCESLLADAMNQYHSNHENIAPLQNVANSCSDTRFGANALLVIADRLSEKSTLESVESANEIYLKVYNDYQGKGFVLVNNIYLNIPVEKSALISYIYNSYRGGKCDAVLSYGQTYFNLFGTYGSLKSFIDECNFIKTLQKKCIGININGNPSSNLDVVFVADGYTDMNKFIADVDDRINKGILSNSLLSSFKDKMNFYYFDELYQGLCYNEGQNILCDYSELILSQACAADRIIILTQIRGRSNAYLFGSVRASSNINVFKKLLGYDPNKVVVHEVGHSFFGLSDEYTESKRGSYPGTPNCAPDIQTAQKWWGSVEETGYYEGCSYVKSNIRPTKNSIMRDPQKTSWGPVNEKAIKDFFSSYERNTASVNFQKTYQIELFYSSGSVLETSLAVGLAYTPDKTNPPSDAYIAKIYSADGGELYDYQFSFQTKVSIDRNPECVDENGDYVSSECESVSSFEILTNVNKFLALPYYAQGDKIGIFDSSGNLALSIDISKYANDGTYEGSLAIA